MTFSFNVLFSNVKSSKSSFRYLPLVIYDFKNIFSKHSYLEFSMYSEYRMILYNPYLCLLDAGRKSCIVKSKVTFSISLVQLAAPKLL